MARKTKIITAKVNRIDKTFVIPDLENDTVLSKLSNGTDLVARVEYLESLIENHKIEQLRQTEKIKSLAKALELAYR
jgi:hypothetical protein